MSDFSTISDECHNAVAQYYCCRYCAGDSSLDAKVQVDCDRLVTLLVNWVFIEM
jgi:hypothetical protein